MLERKKNKKDFKESKTLTRPKPSKRKSLLKRLRLLTKQEDFKMLSKWVESEENKKLKLKD